MIWAFSEATSGCLVCELRRGAFRQGIQELVLQSNRLGVWGRSTGAKAEG